MRTPVVVELPPQHARKQRQEPKALRAFRAAAYVPYRRRSATSTVRVASAVVRRDS